MCNVTSNGGAHEAPKGRPASGCRGAQTAVLDLVYRAQEDVA
jgi:hypothetical protein